MGLNAELMMEEQERVGRERREKVANDRAMRAAKRPTVDRTSSLTASQVAQFWKRAMHDFIEEVVALQQNGHTGIGAFRMVAGGVPQSWNPGMDYRDVDEIAADTLAEILSKA